MPVTSKNNTGIDLSSLGFTEVAPEKESVDLSKLGFTEVKKKSNLSVGSNGKLKESAPTTSASVESNAPNPFDVKSLLPQRVDNSEQPLMFDVKEQKYTPANNFGFDVKPEKNVAENTNASSAIKDYQAATDPTTNTPEIREEKLKKKKENLQKAIDNTTERALKIKGINAQPGSAQYNEQKAKFEIALAMGDATVGVNKDGNMGLKRTIGAWEGLKNGWNEAVHGNKENEEFYDMTPEQRVEFVNKHPEVNKAPDEYIGERPSLSGSAGNLLGSSAPFLGKAAAGAAIGTATGGLGAPAAFAFLLTTPDMINAGVKDEVIRRYQILKNNNTEGKSDVELMQEAGNGALAGGLSGIATNAIQMGIGLKNPVAPEAKNVIGNTIKGVFKSAAEMGAASGGVTALKEAEGNLEGIKSDPKEILKHSLESFKENGTTGFLLTAMLHAPNILKSAFKYGLVKSENPENIKNTLQANENIGKVPEGTTEKVMGDLNQFGTILNSLPEGLTDEVKSSITGLLQKRENLVAEAETKAKSPAIQQIYKDKIESIDRQVGDIQRTGKPLEHEIDEATGETYKKPTFDNIAALKVKNVADKISKGKELTDPEELQAAHNFPEELEKNLNRISREEKSANKDKEKPNTELTDNVNAYLEKNAKEKESSKATDEIPVTTEKVSITDEGTNKNIRPSEEIKIEQIKPDQNAVQIKIPNEMDVRQQTENGEGVGNGNSQSKEPIGEETKITSENKKIENNETSSSSSIQKEQENGSGQSAGGSPTESNTITTEEIKGKGEDEVRATHVQRPPTSLSYMGTGKIETEFGTAERTPTQRKSDLHTLKEADNLIEKGWDVKDLLKKVEDGDAHISDAEYVNLTRYGAELSDRLRSLKSDPSSPEYNKTLAELNRVANVSNMSGKQQGRDLGIRGRFKTVSEGSYGDYMLNELAANNDAPLTEAQKDVANKQYTEFEKAKLKFDEDKAKFDEEVAKFNAEKELGKIKKESKPKAKKTHEDYVKERKDAVEAAREALKKLRTGESGLSAVPLPGVRELIAIAPHVTKAVKSLVEEGAVKLTDAVKQIYEDFKEFGVTERHIHDIIAGEYNEKKTTKKEVAIRAENLRIEAQLINKLESIIKGTEPKNEKQKIKRNQEIESLRNKIKDFRKEETEANKFYGESEATEKRLRAKEDELQRLKDRKEKEPSKTVKEEISDREQKLNDEIKAERKSVNAENAEANKFYGEEKDPQKAALEKIKKINEKETAKIKEKIANKDYALEENKTPLLDDKELQKRFPETFKAAQKSRDELIKTKHDITIRRLKQMYENKTPPERAVEVFSKSLNIPRTLMASMDLSAPLRQAVIATTAHPVLAKGALKFMLQAAKDEKVYNRWLDDVHNSPRWDIAEKTKLSITDPESLHVREHEEAFQGAPYAEKIPIIGKGVAASERAYVGYLNKLRWDLFNMYADRFEEQGKTFENNPKLYKGLSSFINSSTGRGGMQGLESASPILNWVLFASKLIASRVNMLGLSDIPNLALRGATLGKYGFDYGFYTKLPKELRIEAAKDMAKFVAVGISTLLIAKGLSNATGGNIEVETDPRSSDFGKIKSGNVRWDIWGGFQPYARVLTQVLMGQRKASTTGKIYELDGKGFMGENRLTPLANFARGKLAPIPSLAINLASGRDAVGQPVTVGGQLLSNVTPLIINDVYSAIQDQGVKALFTVGIPSALGVGVQTYKPKESTGTIRNNNMPGLKKLKTLRPKKPTVHQ